MKQYIYSASECGFRDWPSGTLRLEGIDVTTNSIEADLFTVPGALTALFPNRGDLYSRLPYFRGREDVHVLFDVSDHEQLYDLPCLFIRCNTRTWYFGRDPNTISFAWPVEDYAECVDAPEGFKYDVSFQGWYSTKTREESAASCLGDKRLKPDIQGYSDFTGYLWKDGKWTPEGLRRRAEFRRSMRESRVMLCGESIPGVFPYRFWEALSAGRVPLLIGHDYVLPFADEIPYESFILTLRRDEASRANQVVHQFINQHNDAEILEMGKRGREYWLKLLNSNDWPKTMAYAVRKALAKSKALACG